MQLLSPCNGLSTLGKMLQLRTTLYQSLCCSLSPFLKLVLSTLYAIIPKCNFKAWFPYNRPDRPSRLKKKCSEDRDDHMETLPRRSQTTRTTETTSIAWIELSSIQV